MFHGGRWGSMALESKPCMSLLDLHTNLAGQDEGPIVLADSHPRSLYACKQNLRDGGPSS